MTAAKREPEQTADVGALEAAAKKLKGENQQVVPVVKERTDQLVSQGSAAQDGPAVLQWSADIVHCRAHCCWSRSNRTSSISGVVPHQLCPTHVCAWLVSTMDPVDVSLLPHILKPQPTPKLLTPTLKTTTQPQTAQDSNP